MNELHHDRDKGSVVNTTHIGTVTGQVSSGSGGIYIGSFSVGEVSTKDQFLAALREFRNELEAARDLVLPEETVDDAVTEIEAAQREAERDAPKSERIIKRLENTRNILVAGTGVATAASAATEATGKLIPLLENAVQAINRIF